MLSPAKLNLFLAITGRRPDGYHDLVSVVAPVAWGDELAVEPGAGKTVELVCDDPAVPPGPDNLILRAAAAFAEAGGGGSGLRFQLAKRIPMGAGLGGGSSNAATALLLLNRASPAPLPRDQITALAARLGSDCPLFMGGGPVVMRGRGERLYTLPANALRRISGRQVVIFKPGFAISTPWAYAQLAAGAPGSYLAEAEAELRLAHWLDDSTAPLESLLFNNMEPPAFAKFPALPGLATLIRERHGLEVRMSGSGSACFALLPERPGTLGEEVSQMVRTAWGDSAFCRVTILATGQIPV